MWKLCSILLSDEIAGLRRLSQFRNWLRAALRHDSARTVLKLHEAGKCDPYETIFHLLAYGNVEDAENVAKKRGDERLARMLVTPLVTEEQQREFMRQAGLLDDEGYFVTAGASPYRRKIWRMLYGRINEGTILSWSKQDRFTWLQVLGTIIFYVPVSKVQDPLCGLLNIYARLGNLIFNGQYNYRTKPWYSLLTWWWQRQKDCENKCDPDAKVDTKSWPFRLAWLFTLQYPQTHDDQDRVWVTEGYCTHLGLTKLMKEAIFSSLFANR